MNDGLSPSGKMASEKVVVSAPMSFAGSAQRIWKLTDQEAVAVKVVMTILALTLIPLAWSFVLSWYLCFGLLLCLFGFLFLWINKNMELLSWFFLFLGK